MSVTVSEFPPAGELTLSLVSTHILSCLLVLPSSWETEAR